MPDYEKLGCFYLGAEYDPAAARRRPDLVLYDSKDLVTHAVCVGMTGSGKTGLCTVLLEEAAIDGIPAIVIDPKGDLPNLLLTFPELRGSDFQPWINESDAARAGVQPAEFAEQQAQQWKAGLAEWHQQPQRIARLRAAAEFAIYTPGSNTGLPVSILKSFAAPLAAIRDDSELFKERVASTAGSLLGLLSIDADPLRSREHILLSRILYDAWDCGTDLDLAAIIQLVQKPGFTRVGVLELEAFYPAGERFALAMQLNNLLAAPGFSRWLEGDALDISSILYTPAGKPRIAIFSIAHLSDPERMFFVSLLLNQTLGWARAQSGTTSLRALLYMDEIAGYFPPVANPPSKAPLLTLMKQARAFGLGVVLATQNPVDLDYKGLSNAGTWFIGRLQTEQDKARVLDGLQGASAAASARFDRAALERILSSLGKRVFVMNNVHDDGPIVFETRWALSYLRGPLTRTQIRTLTDTARAAAPPAVDAVPATPPRATLSGAASGRPVLPPEIPQYFVPLRSAAPPETALHYEPMLLGCARIYYSDAKVGVECEQPLSRLAELRVGPVAVAWEDADATPLTAEDLLHDPDASATFGELPPDAAKPRCYEAWKKTFVDALFRSARLDVLRSELGESSQLGESERDFRARLSHAARERRDDFSARLRAKFAARMQALEERRRRAQQAVDVQQAQASESRFSSALSFGSAVLGAFLGRKVLSAGNVGKAATAVRSAGRAAKEGGDVQRAAENVAAVESAIADLQTQIEAELQAFADKIDPQTEEFERIQIKPKKSGIAVRAVVLAWAPFWRGRRGDVYPAWR
jgi:Helicase HerA, central domain